MNLKIIDIKQNNIIWIERGIIICLLNIITNEYDNLRKKTIIINNEYYKIIMEKLFPKLKFNKFTKHSKKNFYINIRNIIYKKDIIIDYLDNYNYFINTDKINLIPWYDLNDPLIYYKYNSKEKKYVTDFKIKFTKFNLIKRNNYSFNNMQSNYNESWDIFYEYKTLKNYSNIFLISIINILNIINNYLTTYYKVKNYDIILKKNVILNSNNNSINNSNNNIQSNNNSTLIEILTKKITYLNEILENK